MGVLGKRDNGSTYKHNIASVGAGQGGYTGLHTNNMGSVRKFGYAVLPTFSVGAELC